MHCFVTYVAGKCWYLPKISSEIQVFNFWCLSPGHSTVYLRQQECEKPLSFFVAKRGPRARTFGKHDGRRSIIVTVMFIQQLPNQKHKLECTGIESLLISNTQLKILFCSSQLVIFAIKLE
jgi:hypothetical protein